MSIYSYLVFILTEMLISKISICKVDLNQLDYEWSMLAKGYNCIMDGWMVTDDEIELPFPFMDY